MIRSRWLLPAVTAAVFATTWLLARQSFFFADDFLFADYFIHNRVTVEELIRPWFGHLMPGYILADVVFLKLFGLSWAPAALIIAGIHAGALVALVRCLDAAQQARRLNVLAGIAFSFSIAQVAPAMWWAASLNNFAALALCISTLGCLTRWVVRRRVQYLVAALATYGAAVAFSEKSLLFSLFSVLWCFLVLWRGRRLKARLALLRTTWPAWAGIGLISLVVVVRFVTGSYLASSGEAASTAESAAFVGWGLVGGLVPSLFGTDLWLFHSSPLTWAAVVLANLVVIVLIIVSVRRQPAVVGVWGFVGICVLLNQVALSRRADLLGIQNAGLLRYHIENTAIVWLGLAVIASSVLLARVDRAPPDREGAGNRPRSRTTLVATGAVLVVCGALWVQSTVLTVQASPGHEARLWIDRVAQTWPTDADPKLLNFPVPGGIVLSQMYPYNMSKRVLPQLMPDVQFTDQTSQAWVAGIDGTIGPLKFFRTAEADISTCLADGESVTVPISVPSGYWVLIDYRAEARGALVAPHSELDPLTLEAGSDGVVGYAPQGVPDGGLQLTAKGTSVCLSTVTVGLVDVAPKG